MSHNFRFSCRNIKILKLFLNCLFFYVIDSINIKFELCILGNIIVHWILCFRELNEILEFTDCCGLLWANRALAVSGMANKVAH